MSNKPQPEVILRDINLKLTEFEGIIHKYKEGLDSELRAAEDDPEPYDSLLWTLNRQLTNLEGLESTITSEVWPLVKSLEK
jgi:hypothetical protein